MKKVFLKGPLLTQSGYGHHARTILRALKTRPDVFDIYLQPIPWGQTSWVWENSEERKEIYALLNKTIQYINSNGKFDVSVQVTIPNEWEKLAPVNIGVTAGIETNLVAPQWIEKSALMDKIITISKHSKETYAGTVYEAVNNHTQEKTSYRTQTPIDYVSYPTRIFDAKELDLNLTTDFNFLTVAQLSPRKNVVQLINCFVDQFKDNENVGLIIKANMAKNSIIDRKTTLNNFRQIISSKNCKCKIYLLHGFLTDQEMAGLYTHPKINAIVSTSHGEGFGLPMFEAAYYGMPVLATDWSGHLDFLTMPQKQKNGKVKEKSMFGKISYELKNVQQEAVWDGVIPKESKWAFPDSSSIKKNMEEVYKDSGRFKKRAKQLQKWLREEFSEEKVYSKMVELIGVEEEPDIVII